jgi:hypothetical protein
MPHRRALPVSLLGNIDLDAVRGFDDVERILDGDDRALDQPVDEAFHQQQGSVAVRVGHGQCRRPPVIVVVGHVTPLVQARVELSAAGAWMDMSTMQIAVQRSGPCSHNL